MLTKEKLDSWYEPKHEVSVKEEEVMEDSDNIKCLECGKVDCMCEDDAMERELENKQN